MHKNLKKLLQKIGVANDVIAAFESGDEQQIKDLNIDEIHTGVREGFADALQNDEGFMTPLKNSVRAAVLTPKQKKIMEAAGITKEEFAALPKGKEFDELIDLAVKKLSAKSKDNGSPEHAQEIERLNNEIATLKDTLRKKDEEEIPSIRKEGETVLNNHIIFGMVVDEVQKNNPIIGPKAAAKIAHAYVEKHGDLRLSETKDSVILYQKGKDLKLMGDGNKPVSFSEMIKKACKEEGLTAESNAHITKLKGIKGAGEAGDGGEKGGDGGGQKITNPNILKAKEHSEKMFGSKKKTPAGGDDGGGDE